MVVGAMVGITMTGAAHVMTTGTIAAAIDHRGMKRMSMTSMMTEIGIATAGPTTPKLGGPRATMITDYANTALPPLQARLVKTSSGNPTLNVV